MSASPRGLDPYRPRLRYLLIDQARYDDAELASRHNLAALLFRIESCRQRGVMIQLLSTLREWLKDPELRELRRAFAVWLNRVVLKRLPCEQEHIADNLLEESAMLSETVLEWEKELREEGWQKGRQEGRQEGVREWMARLVRKRFGELPEPIHARLRNASLEELESWTEALMDATSLDDLMGCVPPPRANN